MYLEELKKEVGKQLEEIQSKLDDDTFLIVENGCVEKYNKKDFLPTPVSV